jgi:glycosyltransferase involved in cell wall biosynthesis
MRDALQANFEVPSRCHVIPNGRTLQCKTENLPRKLCAVSVGRLWDEAKGLRTLVEIASPIPIRVAGEDRFAEISALPTQNLATLGPLPEKELLHVFRSSSIYLAASFYEPFGLAPLEAALCGCAIVARDLPSLREVWGAGASYFSDAAELEKLLCELAVNHSWLHQAQLASIARAQLFTAKRMATRYFRLYETLTDSASSSMPLQEETAPDAA